MNWKITIQLGSLNAELSGVDREELQGELLEFMGFIEQNSEKFDSLEYRDVSAVDSDQAQDIEGESISETANIDGESLFGDTPNRTGIEESTLQRYFDIDPSGDEPPLLGFDNEILGETGTSRSEKQMRGSLILLTLWREGLGVEKVMSPNLKDALRISGIDDTNLYNMYGFNDEEGDRYFRREGAGEHTEIALTLPGRREGFDQISRTIERLESDDDDE